MRSAPADRTLWPAITILQASRGGLELADNKERPVEAGSSLVLSVGEGGLMALMVQTTTF